MSNSSSNGMNILRELPSEFDESAREGMRTKARRTKPEHESMGGMSDEWLANELRMLSRHDLWHEAFCTAARDRIMRLSMQLAEARGVIDKLKSSRVETSGDIRYWTGFIDASKVLEASGPEQVWRMAKSYATSIDLEVRRAVEPTADPVKRHPRDCDCTSCHYSKKYPPPR